MKRAVGVVKVLLRGCARVTAVLVVLSWAPARHSLRPGAAGRPPVGARAPNPGR